MYQIDHVIKSPFFKGSFREIQSHIKIALIVETILIKTCY